MAASLTEIANAEATDKGTRGPLAPKGHNYTDIYESYLSSMRNRPITLLEIGLGVQGPVPTDVWLGGRNPRGGASMRMWYRYFPHARILGIDLNPATFLDNERIRTGVVDQGDPRQILQFLDGVGVAQVDVIVDDGSHLPEHQQISLSTLFPVLSPGGLYFIEDLLANGLGDKRNPAGSGVVNSRALLHQFTLTGGFPEPNAFTDAASLARDIAHVSFHCPPIVSSKPSQKPLDRARLAAKILFAGQRQPTDIEYRPPGSEKLCAITKR